MLALRFYCINVHMVHAIPIHRVQPFQLIMPYVFSLDHQDTECRKIKKLRKAVLKELYPKFFFSFYISKVIASEGLFKSYNIQIKITKNA